MHKGSCICGAVTVEVDADLAPPDACHCTQCRKMSSHYFVSTDVPRSAVTVRGEDSVTWFVQDHRIRRGFCGTCGTSLFWDPLKGEMTAVAMGIFDTPTGTHLEKHIFVAEKGDYYDITDGLPQNQR